MDAPFAVAALVDIDDFVAAGRTHGHPWARRQLDQAERVIQAVTRERSPASCRMTPPDEWLVLFTGADPDALMSQAGTLAEEVRAGIVRGTEMTATIGLSTPRAGPLGAAAAERDARLANSYKLLLGGDRVIASPPAVRQEVLPPARIEPELARRIKAGDRGGAARLLADWVDRCARERGLDPATLRNWLMGQLLFVADVVNRGRLASGSTDWIEACERLPVEQLAALTGIHERSYLRIWLDETLERLMPAEPGEDAAPGILAMAESYLAAHYTDPALRLSTVAEAISASPFYISHLFAAERGTTFLRHLTGLRLRHARTLLSTSSLPVDAVAARTGYPSAKALRKVFTRHVGCSPTDYRRAHRPNGPRTVR